jgi:ribosomal protein S4
LVSHGHIRVDGVRNIASRRVDVGSEITLGPKAQEMALVMEAQSSPSVTFPNMSPSTAPPRRPHPRSTLTKCPTRQR